MSDFTTIASHGTEAEAQITVAVLEAHGIEAHLLSDDAGGMLPSLDPRRGVRVLVATADAADARAILAAEGEEAT